MRRSETQKIGSVLKEYVDALKMRGKLNEISIHRHWENLLGKSIMRYTKQLVIKNGVLVVYITSPAMRNELVLRSEKLRTGLNKQIGEVVIKKIIFR